MKEEPKEIDILDWESTRPKDFSFLKHMLAGKLFQSDD